MINLLSFNNIFEFILRYTVLIGMFICIIGTVLCFMAKRITLFKRKTDVLDKKDVLYVGLLIAGICLILVGMVVTVLPIEATLYGG